MSTATQFRAPPRCACQLITVFEPTCDATADPGSQRGFPKLGLTTAHRTGFSNTDEAYVAVHVRLPPAHLAVTCAHSNHATQADWFHRAQRHRSDRL